MNNRKLIRCLSVALAINMLAGTLIACKKDPTAGSTTLTSQVTQPIPMLNGPIPEFQPLQFQMGDIYYPEISRTDLNGQWDFIKDPKAQSKLISADGVFAEPYVLKSGEIAVMKLTVDDPEEMIYSKIVATLSFGSTIETSDGEEPLIYAKINDGRWFTTSIEKFAENQVSNIHKIDIGMSYNDLISGENTIYLKSNLINDELSIMSAASTNGKASVIDSAGKETPLQTDFAIAIKYYPIITFTEEMDKITVPSAWETELDQESEYTPYSTVAWYIREFDMPSADEGKSQILTFDAIDYYAEIWINDRFVISHENGYTGIDIDLSQYKEFLYPQKNKITVRVTDQNTNIGSEFHIKETLAGFYHDTVGVNYGGIWNDVYLTERGALRATDLTVSTDFDQKKATVDLEVLNTGASCNGDLTVTIYSSNGEIKGTKTLSDIAFEAGKTLALSVDTQVADAAKWEINAPNVYTAVIQISVDGKELDKTYTTFGFTDIKTVEDKIFFNDKAIKLNGVLSWLDNWDQLSPRFDAEEFTNKIKEIKQLGFNAIKFCLVVPPDYLLDICDRAGIYVYIEYPIWQPNATEAFYERAYSQIPEMVEMSKNHPSVIMSDFNCEMMDYDSDMAKLMNWCVKTGKQIDKDRLFCDNSTMGYQLTTGNINDFWTWHPYTEALDFSEFAQSLVDGRNKNGKKPMVFGEYCDYPSLLDYDKVLRENGGEEPWYWEAADDPFRATEYLTKLGYSKEQIQQLIDDSVFNSLDMKMHIVQETKKVDGVAAYFLTLMGDVGANLGGFYDETGDAKFTAEQLAFLRETVLLMNNNVYNYVGGKTTKVTPAISHYNGTKIEKGTLSYAVLDSEGKILCGDVLQKDIELENGDYYTFQRADIYMPATDTVQICKLVFFLEAEGQVITNSWNVFVYPDNVGKEVADLIASGKTVMISGATTKNGFKSRYPGAEAWKDGANPDLLVAYGKLTGAQIKYLRDGGKVLYLGSGSEVVKVEKCIYYSQYVMIHFPMQDHEIIKALTPLGYGGLQLLRMKTEGLITERSTTPLKHSLIGKIPLRDNVSELGDTGSYMSEFTIGKGTLIQSTLNFETGDSVVGDYLIDISMNYLLSK